MAEDTKMNPDNADLGWWRAGNFVVGRHVDEVNGRGAQEVPAFVPRHELIQVVKYWATVLVDLDFDWFLYRCTGSSEMRRTSFARRRISRIAAALGRDEVDKAVCEAQDEFAKHCDPREWNIFLNGTAEEQTALRKEIQRELGGVESGQDEQ